MPKKTIKSSEAPAAIGPYSQAVQAGPWIWASGQIPLDPSTGIKIEGDIAAQTARCLENLKAVLSAAGADLSDVVKTTVFLADLGDFEGMNRVYGSYFPVDAPARSTVQVARLPKDARVEIEAVCYQEPLSSPREKGSSLP
ncbi:MAG: RidA family protein [candidate division FCPU426 bacterium]